MILSIIVPIFNCEKYLNLCLKRICDELDEQIELILVNDGSSDNSLNIIKEYNKKYDNIKVINKKNSGVSRSRNDGIKLAQGEYIMFVDADDYLEIGWKNKALSALKSKSDLYIFNNNINIENFDKKRIIFSIVYQNDKQLKYLSSPWSKIYKRKIILNNNILFSNNIINGEDMIFNLNYISCINKIYIVKNSIYNYRISNTSSTKRFNEKIFMSDKDFYSCLNKCLDMDVYNLNSKEIQEINNFLIKTNIYTLALRMSYTRDYKIFKNNYTNLEYYFKKITNKINIGFFKNIIVLLLQKRLLILSYLLLRLKVIIKKSKNDYFIKV